MELNIIYSPIKEELQEVEEVMRKELLATQNEFLLELIAYLLKNPGKRLRPALILLSLKATGGWNPKAIPVAAAIEILHTATLVHDDILDEAELRRDQITVNVKWGDDMALLLGDYLYFKAFSILSRVNEKKISEVVSATAQKICEGEVTQTCRAFDTGLNEEDYLKIIKLKTASFMGACCRIGSILAGAGPLIIEALEKFGLNFGMAFQILDDCLDFFSSTEKTGKTIGRDIQQGKMTLPLIYLQKIIQKEGNKIDTDKLFSRQEEIVTLLKEYRVTEFCIGKINSFLNTAEQKINIMLEPSLEKDSLILITRYLREKSLNILCGEREVDTSSTKTGWK